MRQAEFGKKVQELFREHEKLITRKNVKAKRGNGVYDRYANPVLTAEHTPLFWRYDFDQQEQSAPDGAYGDECDVQRWGDGA